MLWKCLGEKHILPNITDLDELKLNKIKEYAEKAVLLNLRGEPRAAGGATAAPATTTTAKTTSQPVNSATMTKKPAGATVVKPDSSADKDDEAASPAATTVKPAAAAVKKKPTSAAKPAAAKSEAAEERREPRPPKVDFDDFFTNIFDISSLPSSPHRCSCVRSTSLRAQTYKHIHTCVLSFDSLSLSFSF